MRKSIQPKRLEPIDKNSLSTTKRRKKRDLTPIYDEESSPHGVNPHAKKLMQRLGLSDNKKGSVRGSYVSVGKVKDTLDIWRQSSMPPKLNSHEKVMPLHSLSPPKGAISSAHSAVSRKSRVRSLNVHPVSDVESMQSMQIIREVQMIDAGTMPNVDLQLPLLTCELCLKDVNVEVKKPAISRCNFNSGDGGFAGCGRSFCEVHGQPHYEFAHNYLKKLGDEKSTAVDGGAGTDRRQENREKIRRCTQVILQMPIYSS